MNKKSFLSKSEEGLYVSSLSYTISKQLTSKETTIHISIKNLSYYYISHFSRFIKKNSNFIETSKYTDKIEVLASKKENEIIVILLNRNDQNYEYNLCINGKYLHDNLDSHSIITFVIK